MGFLSRGKENDGGYWLGKTFDFVFMQPIQSKNGASAGLVLVVQVQLKVHTKRASMASKNLCERE